MGKWISDRMKRRKKTGDGSPKPAAKALEPLQPRFYDDEPAAPVEAPAVESRPPSKPEPELAIEHVASQDSPSTAVSTEASTVAEPQPRPSRRRRSRGGRGGSRAKPEAPAPTTAAEPPATEATAPELLAAEKPPLETATAAAVPDHVPPAPAAAAPARPSKGTVVLAIGLPGSGKSSWFKRHNIHPLSSDLLRELLFDDAQEQRFQDLVFSNLRSMLKARLIARRPMNYVDATNLTPHDRHSWIKLAKDYGYDVQGLFFDVPLEICLERHRRRGRVVPEEIMHKMAGKLKAPTFDEGFSKITVVRVKQKEEAAG